MIPSAPDPVKLFVGALISDQGIFEQTIEMLVREYGAVDFHSEPIPFDVTDYYQDEMGGPIQRIFLSFQELIDPGGLAEIKIKTNRIEEELAVDGQRKVNLDCGYMDVCKVVLASAKYNGQKIYLGQGIYADPTLHYEKGRFEPYPWSFPDFKTGRYEKIFLKIRELYKVGRK
ncbi:DUF4416 family protein [Candidatus Zixiibacteriota bacterium]